jgi:N-acetyl-anhydromuramyl-L-alanine amidase AmpD
LSSLVKHLVKAYNIPEENILTHASITRSWSKYKKLWDGKSPSRKVDCWRELRMDKYNTFAEYRKSFYAVA